MTDCWLPSREKTLGFLAALCAMVFAGCESGPSEWEVEATVEARVARAIETRVPPAATPKLTATPQSEPTTTGEPTAAPVPTVVSVFGLALPHDVSFQRFSIDAISVDDGRRQFRDLGCLQCSRVLDDHALAPFSYNSDRSKSPAPLVAIGDFFNDDGLMDAVLRNVTLLTGVCWGCSASAYFEYTVFENNGASLVERGGVQRGFDLSSGYPEIKFRAASENWKGFKANNRTFLNVRNGRRFAFYDFAGNTRRTPSGRDAWLGDFDDDPEVELGIVDDDTPITVLELDGEFTWNEDATTAITRATRDFAANLADSEESDFNALWREHGPSASVAALALISNMDLDSYRDQLQLQFNQGRSVYEAARAINESQAQ